MAENAVESTAQAKPADVEAPKPEATAPVVPTPNVEETAKGGERKETDVAPTSKQPVKDPDLEKKGMDYWTSQAQKAEYKAERAEYERDKANASLKKLESRLDKAGMKTEDTTSVDSEKQALERGQAEVSVKEKILPALMASDLDERTRKLILSNPFGAVDATLLETAIDKEHAVELAVKAIKTEYLTKAEQPQTPAPNQPSSPKVVGNNPIDQPIANRSTADNFHKLDEKGQKVELEQMSEEVYGEKIRL